MSDKTIDLAEYEKASPMIWSSRNVRLPKRAPWDFQHRKWQAAIFDDNSREIVVIKPTQIGMTTLMLCKMLHFAHYHPVRVMYTLPRQDDVYDLVNGRVSSMFRDSPLLSSMIGSSDNVRFKVYGDSYLHFMESSVTPRMLDVDCLVNDEIDMSNQDNLEQYIARLDASEYKIHWRISTPTVNGFGIDSLFDKSDKKRWIIKCPRCNHEQELIWDNNIRNSGGETWYACGQCDREFTPDIVQSGSWIADHPGRDISGYAVSQMMVTSIPPSSLWEDSKTMRTKNFYNLRLGKPYTQSTGSITRQLIYDKCIRNTHGKEYAGSGYFMGADQGNDIHVVIGKAVGDTIEIVYMDVIPLERGFDELYVLMDRFGIQQAVIDGLPNRHSANSFASFYRGGRALMAFYTQTPDVYKENALGFRVEINRSIAFDYLYEKINAGEIALYGDKTNLTNELRLAVSHLASMRRDEVLTNTKMGGEKTEVAWVHSGPDHFAHAINYLNVAVDLATSSSGFRITRLGEPKQSDSDDEEVVTEQFNNNPYVLRRALTRVRDSTRRFKGIAR